MRCINKKLISYTLLIFILMFMTGCTNKDLLAAYTSDFNTNISEAELFSKDLAQPLNNVALQGYEENEQINATAIFDVVNSEILQSKNLMEEISPASTTKIMTAYLALKYGDLNDIITISKTAANLPSDAQVCGLQEGDTISLKDLLAGLIISSGNDAAIAIAEYISEEHSKFIDLMNEEASLLGATHTNYKNAHGLDEMDHVTTVYDLYLIFNEAIKNEHYVEMLKTTRYTTSIKNQSGTEREVEWTPTNYYHVGRVKAPENLTVIGGVTGTTSKAKNCLILLVEDVHNNPYITISMGSSTRDGLYENLNKMLEILTNRETVILEDLE